MKSSLEAAQEQLLAHATLHPSSQNALHPVFAAIEQGLASAPAFAHASVASMAPGGLLRLLAPYARALANQHPHY